MVETINAIPPYLNFPPSSISFIFATLIDSGVIHVMSKFQRNLSKRLLFEATQNLPFSWFSACRKMSLFAWHNLKKKHYMIKFLFTNETFQRNYIYHYFNVKFKGFTYLMIYLGMLFEENR
jgi:hypothetical protein